MQIKSVSKYSYTSISITVSVSKIVLASLIIKSRARLSQTLHAKIPIILRNNDREIPTERKIRGPPSFKKYPLCSQYLNLRAEIIRRRPARMPRELRSKRMHTNGGAGAIPIGNRSLSSGSFAGFSRGDARAGRNINWEIISPTGIRDNGGARAHEDT